MIDPYLIDLVIKRYFDEKADYCCNNQKLTFPRGMAAEVVSTDLLESIANTNHDKFVREHVTLDFYENPKKYKFINIEAPEEYRMPDLRLCIDTQEDLELVKTIYEELYPENPDFGIKDIIELIKAKPHIKDINSHIRQKGARE
jgi:spore coat polysaccharide biosynthesis protein SpsF